jgi:hypothetical protein
MFLTLYFYLQLGFGESIQQQVGPWKLSLPGNTQTSFLFLFEISTFCALSSGCVLDAACGDSHSLALLTESEDGRGSTL